MMKTIIMILLLTSCGSDKTFTSLGGLRKTEAQTAGSSKSSLAFKNFLQYNSFLKSSFGGEEDVVQVISTSFVSVRFALPQASDANKLTEGEYKSLVAHASEPCEFISRQNNNLSEEHNNRRKKIFGIESFPPNLTVSQTDTMAQSLILNFWGTKESNDLSWDQNIEEVKKYGRSLVAAEESSFDIAKFMCTLVASTGPSIEQ